MRWFFLIDAYDIGPLGALKRAIVERRQIKVWTRSAAGVKATLIGTLLLFDKHMNMVRGAGSIPVSRLSLLANDTGAKGSCGTKLRNSYDQEI